MKFTCPVCGFDGEFEKGKTPFLIMSLGHSKSERMRAKRTHICPKCRTQIVLPKRLPKASCLK